MIVDFLWDGFAPYAMNHANIGARYIQVGSSAGPTSTIAAPVFRNKLLTLVGHGLAATPAEVRRSAYAQLVHHAIDGKLNPAFPACAGPWPDVPREGPRPPPS